jgi:hypothetical protein
MSYQSMPRRSFGSEGAQPEGGGNYTVAAQLSPPGPVHRELNVDGVPVLHFPSDNEVTAATLIFGVGQRDETLATYGALHALEHF